MELLPESRTVKRDLPNENAGTLRHAECIRAQRSCSEKKNLPARLRQHMRTVRERRVASRVRVLNIKDALSALHY